LELRWLNCFEGLSSRLASPAAMVDLTSHSAYEKLRTNNADGSTVLSRPSARSPKDLSRPCPTQPAARPDAGFQIGRARKDSEERIEADFIERAFWRRDEGLRQVSHVEPSTARWRINQVQAGREAAAWHSPFHDRSPARSTPRARQRPVTYVPPSGTGSGPVFTGRPVPVERRAWDSNPRGRFRALAVFKTAAIGH
jgi:hypothetical protein